jgi:hypothetical protein
MPNTAPHPQFRRAVRGFYAWLGALVFAAAAPIAAKSLVESGSLPIRIAGVLLGTLSWVPMAFVIAAIIRAGDEFQQRLHLVAIAMAFASGLVLLTLLDWLVRARFMQPPPLQLLWLGYAVLWIVCLFVVRRRLERE